MLKLCLLFCNRKLWDTVIQGNVRSVKQVLTYLIGNIQATLFWTSLTTSFMSIHCGSLRTCIIAIWTAKSICFFMHLFNVPAHCRMKITFQITVFAYWFFLCHFSSNSSSLQFLRCHHLQMNHWIPQRKKTNKPNLRLPKFSDFENMLTFFSKVNKNKH